MTISLRSLCADFCDLARVPTPQLHADDEGATSFNIVLRDVAVDLTTLPSADPDHAFAIFHMGTPDPAHGDFARILRALLHTNFIGLNAHQPVFSCRPESQAIVMHMAIALAQTSGEELHRLIDQGVDLVLQWRQTYFLEPANAGSAPAPESVGSYA